MNDIDHKRIKKSSIDYLKAMDAKSTIVNFSVGNDEYITKMKTTFTVPSIPEDTSENFFLYLWPGIQSDRGGILQPVLAFHSTYPSWYLHTYAISPDDNPHVQGEDYDIPVGTELTGVIEFIERTREGAFTYKVFFEGYPESTSCTHIWSIPARIAYQAIEPWYVTNQNQFPSEQFLIMKNIEIITNKRIVKDAHWISNNPRVQFIDEKILIPYWNGLHDNGLDD